MSNKVARLYTLLFLGITLILINSQVALAGSWWQITASDTVGSGVWNDTTTVGNAGFSSPHGGFSTSSNLCKTCHAVHAAGDSSFRLLKDGTTVEGRTQGEGGTPGKGNSAANECMYCHDADSGASSLRPYEMAATGKTVRGEHTVGATAVPDSDINGGSGDIGNLSSGALGCYDCHSVHGANTINANTYNASDSLESWNTKILRLDPAGDGSVLAKGSGGLSAPAWEAELTNPTSGPGAVRTGFCADCHDQNSNWTTTNSDTDRPNKRSHPQGRGLDGLMAISAADSTDIAVAAHTNARQGCRGCHTASDGRGLPGISRFPHQSGGWKLMWDSYTDTSTVDLAGDPRRVTPNMDRVCLMCHPVDNQFDSRGSKGYADSTVEEKLCFRCHMQGSIAGAPDVQSQFAKLSTHPTSDTSGRHTDNLNESAAQLGIANRHAECLDCHNTDTVVQGQGQPLRGIWGVRATNGASGSTPTLAKVAGVSAEQELCFKCHSSYTTRPNSGYYTDAGGSPIVQEDKSVVFNPNNNAFHPVEGAGRNKSGSLNNTLLGGLTGDSTIKCTDCHNSNDTSSTPGPVSNSSFKPKGPHGSSNAPVLRANYTTDLSSLPTTYDKNNFAMCFICHDESKLTTNTAGYTNFYNNAGPVGNRNLHKRHLVSLGPLWVDGGYGTCRVCHYDVHGNQQAPNTEYGYYNGTWHVGSSPNDNHKTHMVNFAPVVNTPGNFAKPRFQVWESVEGVTPARARACDVVCHGNNAEEGWMDDGSPGYTNSTYLPPLATDDALTY